MSTEQIDSLTAKLRHRARGVDAPTALMMREAADSLDRLVVQFMRQHAAILDSAVIDALGKENAVLRERVRTLEASIVEMAPVPSVLVDSQPEPVTPPERYADSIAAQLRRTGYHSAADEVVSLADGNEMLARERDELADAVAEMAPAPSVILDAQGRPTFRLLAESESYGEPGWLFTIDDDGRLVVLRQDGQEDR